MKDKKRGGPLFILKGPPHHHHLRLAAYAGMVNMFLFILNTFLFFRAVPQTPKEVFFYLFIALLTLTTYFVFVWGFIFLADLTSKTIIKISASFIIAASVSSLLFSFYSFFGFLRPELEIEFMELSALIIGIASIFFGVTIINLIDTLKEYAYVVVFSNIIIGILFLIDLFSPLLFPMLLIAYGSEILLLLNADKILYSKRSS